MILIYFEKLDLQEGYIRRKFISFPTGRPAAVQGHHDLLGLQLEELKLYVMD